MREADGMPPIAAAEGFVSAQSLVSGVKRSRPVAA
jgi:hypothetical protein